MKQELINILNGLNAVTTNGQSLMILAQCMSQLAQIIDSMPDEEVESKNKSKENK
jgi:hypothetical protein